MKRVLLGLVLILGSTVAIADTLTSEDRMKGLNYLEKTRDGIVAATKGLSDAQMKFKPGPDRWSVAEVLEHIALSEDYFYEHVTTKVMKAPPPPSGRDTAKTDSTVVSTITDRSQKAQAPPELVPTGRWSPRETLDHFLKTRTKMVEFLKKTPDLREHALANSPLGTPLDAYDTVLFSTAHSERHTKQILEVSADSNFPKK